MDGHVYGWGLNIGGEVGDGTTNEILIPKLIGNESITFIDIKIGFCTTMGLTRDGHVYVWGCNDYNQIYKEDKGIHTPIEIPYLEQIKSIHCTDTSSFAVHEDGRIFGWGDNSCGQLCLGHSNPVQLIERKDYLNTASIDDLTPFKIKKIIFGAYHVLMLDEDGQLYSWGCNSYGQLGDGTTNNRNNIYKIDVQSKLNKVSDIFAVDCISIFKTEEDDVYVFGSYNQNELLVPTKVEKKFEEIMKEIETFKGMTYTWTSTEDNEEDGDEEEKEEEDDDHKEGFKTLKSKLLSEGLFDVTLVIDGQEIKGHRVMLSLASRKFRTLFKENEELNRFVLNGIKFEVIKSMIDFIYGKDLEPELLVDLFIAVHDFEIDDLHKAAETELIKQLKPENALKYAFLGGNYNSSSLQDAALQFALSGSHSKEMINAFKNNFSLK